MAVIVPTSSKKVLDIARAEIGTHEDPPYSNNVKYSRWYGLKGPWCDMFVSWCLHEAGAGLPKSAYTPSRAKYFQDRGAWADARSGYIPKAGDIALFNFPGDGVNRISHVGIVEGMTRRGASWRDHVVAMIEGNTNGRGSRTGGNVMRHNRTVAGGIVGYGVVTYQHQESIVEEDEDMRIFHITEGPDANKFYLVIGNDRDYIDTEEELKQWVAGGVVPRVLGGRAWARIRDRHTALDITGLRDLPPRRREHLDAKFAGLEAKVDEALALAKTAKAQTAEIISTLADAE